MSYLCIMLLSVLLMSNKSYVWLFFYSFLFLLFYMKFLFITGECMYNGHYVLSHFDSVSLFFFILTVWVCLFSFFPMMYSENSPPMFLFFLITIILLMLFSTNNMFFFFVLFEGSLVPIFFVIINWSSYKERVQSVYYFIMYTMVTSIPLLLFMSVLIYKSVTSYMYVLLLNIFFVDFIPWFCVLGLLLGFMSKLPVYSLHIWLPKAHVDAPISGSMILASVLLKLGSYSVMRVMFVLDFLSMSFFLVGLSVLSYFITASICLRQVDMKVLVAYSSVNHMSLAFSSVFSYIFWSFKGAFLLFFGHSIVSPLMFFFAHFMSYRSQSRLMHGNKGFFSIFPFFMSFMFIMFLVNLSVPPFMNFFGEFSIFYSIFKFNSFLGFLIFYSFIMSSVFIYNMFTTTSHGLVNMGLMCNKSFFNEMFISSISFMSLVCMSFFLEVML